MNDFPPRRELPMGNSENYWKLLRSVAAAANEAMRRLTERLDDADQVEAAITYELAQVGRAKAALDKLQHELTECLLDLEYWEKALAESRLVIDYD